MDVQSNDTQGSSLSPEQEGLTLPDGLQLLEKVGKGTCCTVYKAQYQGETVALKAYTSSAADWYRKKLNKNIAVYEMFQNRAFRKNAELLPYTAKPLRVIGQDGSTSLCFLQEFVDGITLEELGERNGSIPSYVLQTGELIARTCEDNGIKGVNKFMKNVLFVQQSSGNWAPVIHDFKHVPPDKEKKPSGPSFLSRLGFGSQADLGTGFMKEWNQLDLKLEKAGG